MTCLLALITSPLHFDDCSHCGIYNAFRAQQEYIVCHLPQLPHVSSLAMYFKICQTTLDKKKGKKNW